MTNRCGVRAAAIGWGIAVVGERGWRAEWTRIERLWFRPRCVICGDDAQAGLFSARGSGPLLLCSDHESPEFERRRLSIAGRMDVREMRHSLESRYGVPVERGDPDPLAIPAAGVAC